MSLYDTMDRLDRLEAVLASAERAGDLVEVRALGARIGEIRGARAARLYRRALDIEDRILSAREAGRVRKTYGSSLKGGR